MPPFLTDIRTLVLFLLTFILNGLARLLIVVTTQRGSGMGLT